MGRNTTVVVGGGFSGAAVAGHLLRTRDDTVTIVEPRARLGRGIAYDTDDDRHLLNSPAGAMSARPGVPDDFLLWCRRRGLADGERDFLPRRAYGRYVQATLDDAASAHPGRLRLVRRHAVGLQTGGRGPVSVRFADGGVLDADRVVLALGHTPGADPPGVPVGDPGYVGDPWAPGALDAVRPGEPVVLLGTGLTAVDVVLSLVGRGHSGGVHALSRHGLLPRRHEPVSDHGPPPALPTGGEPLGAILRAVRRAAAGREWRPVVDALRPRADALWRGLAPVERDRFLRHVARYWEVHRHRMAPAVAETVDRLLGCGELTVTAGRPLLVDREGPRLRVLLPGGRELRAGTVINCTGPGSHARGGDPLVRSLLADGLARPDRLGIGLDVDDAGLLLDRAGRADPRLWTVGPVRRGRWWETTAVPEIRAQVATL